MNLLKIMILGVWMLIIPVMVVAQTAPPSEKSNNPITNNRNLKKEQLKRAVRHAVQLKEGVLVVRVQTFNNKINALRRLTKDHPTSKRYKKQLENALEERKEILDSTITVYTEEYSYSKVYFMPDTAAKSLLKGVKRGIFFNPQTMEVDKSIVLDQGDYMYLTYIGEPPIAISNGKMSLLIADSENRLVSLPFPYATPLYSFVQTILGYGDADVIRKAVVKQQEQLEKFFDKTKSIRDFDD